MTAFDGCFRLDAGDWLGWRSEIAARVGAFLDRRFVPGAATPAVLAGARSLLDRVAGAASLASLKRAVGELLSYLRHRALAVASSNDGVAELEQLYARIRAHGARGTIEAYCEYLFTVPVSF